MAMLKKCGELVQDCIIKSTKLFFSFALATGPILLDDLSCTGLEFSLETCSHRGIGTHSCDHGEDVILSCTGGNSSK